MPQRAASSGVSTSPGAATSSQGISLTWEDLANRYGRTPTSPLASVAIPGQWARPSNMGWVRRPAKVAQTNAAGSGASATRRTASAVIPGMSTSTTTAASTSLSAAQDNPARNDE